MKAIYVKYLGPTNTKPSRWKAYDGDGNSVTISHSYESAGENGNGICAVVALLRKMEWRGVWVVGGGGTVAVCVQRTKGPGIAVSDWDYMRAQEELAAAVA